ncbi:MAG: hypothetical protein ACOX2K_08215 [Bacillota bacterium]
MRYYTHIQPKELAARIDAGIAIAPVAPEQVRAAVNPEIHINWQNTLEYIATADVSTTV